MSRCADGRGSAIVTVVFAIFLASLLGTIAVGNTVQALKHASKNEKIKRAQQGAESAVESAIFGLNRLDLLGALDVNAVAPQQVSVQSCLTSTAAGMDLVQLPIGETWCGTVTQTSSSGVTWAYRISQLARVGTCGTDGVISLDRRIVATGTYQGVTRRVTATLRAPITLMSGAAVQSGSTTTNMTLGGTAAITGNIHANAGISGTAIGPSVTGTAIAGPGASVSGFVAAGGNFTACTRFVLPNVAQGTAPTVNNNGTQDNPGWTVTCAEQATGLTVNCKPALLSTTGGADWDASKRTLRTWGNAKVTLTGSTYSFCRLQMTGESLVVIPPTTSTVRIFLDDPANCNGVTGPGQLTIDTNAKFTNCHAQTNPGSLQVYAVGSATTATTHTMAGAGLLTGGALQQICGVNLSLLGVPMIVYAPRSRLDIAGNTTIAGQVAANVVNISGQAKIVNQNAIVNLNELGARPVLPIYRPTGYLSCTSKSFDDLPLADPTYGC